MAKAGRKPKAGARELNGRLQRPTTKAMLNKMAEKARLQEQSVVLRQPHRQGQISPLAESPLGRLCLRRKLRQEIYEAAMSYGSIVACWRGAKGVPAGLRYGDSGSVGDGPSDDAVRRWQTQMLEIERAVVRHGTEALLTLRTLVLDEEEIGIEREEIVIVALQAVAVELGVMREHTHACG